MSLIMDEFEIDEISVVDRPAQEGAKAMIIKRRADEMSQLPPSVFAELKKYATNALESGHLADGTPLTEERRMLIMENFVIDEISAADNPTQELQEDDEDSEAVREFVRTREKVSEERRAEAVREAFAVLDIGIQRLESNHKVNEMTLMTRARDLAENEKIPLHAAMTKARQADPGAYEKHQRDGIKKADAARAELAKSTPRKSSTDMKKFRDEINDLMKREGISYTQASARLQKSDRGPYGRFSG